MLDTAGIRTEALPEGMRVLLETHPRGSWDSHPGFRERTRQWMAAHQMFRRLAELVRSDAEQYVDRSKDTEVYVKRLSRFGNQLVGNLHGHHGWEDREFFPELSTADPRFDRGLELLENDHRNLDLVLADFTRSANRVIKLIDLNDGTEALNEAGEVVTHAQTIEQLLARHLTDEEDLAVPIILQHRLRG